ncbi:hypothetical protein AAG570_003925 [Ranatra chinensis]|uniref:Uncharacterized protein n=1 Tax=Ranatra chinensis TaxID=642074 RepID=A0ABD0Y4K6_9HEMI
MPRGHRLISLRGGFKGCVWENRALISGLEWDSRFEILKECPCVARHDEVRRSGRGRALVREECSHELCHAGEGRSLLGPSRPIGGLPRASDVTSTHLAANSIHAYRLHHRSSNAGARIASANRVTFDTTTDDMS